MMLSLVAEAQAVFLISVYKPILFIISVGIWANVVSRLDKDCKRYLERQRQYWNILHTSCLITAVGLWMVLPWFWAGQSIFVLTSVGSILGYGLYRNTTVDDDKKWTFSFASLRGKSDDDDEEKESKATSAAAVKLIAPDGKTVEVPEGEDPRVEAHQALEQVLDVALPRKAQRIELLADQTGVAVAVEIDGVRYQQPPLELKLGLTLIDYLKSAANLDTQDRRKRQSATIKVDASALGRHSLAMSTFGSTKGLNLSMELMAGGPQTARKLPELGMLEAQIAQLKPVLDGPGRVVMVVCPSGQGMTNTIYSLLTHHDPYTQSIHTLEDAPLFDLEGITQSRIDFAAGHEPINQKIKSLTLRDAAVIMVGKVSDPSTARMIVENSTTTRFYFGLRQEDSFSALKAWVKAVGDANSAAESLGAILSQRLLRMLCKTCKVPYKPDSEALRKLNLPADRVKDFYRHSGKIMVKDKEQDCPDCLGIGYKGRVAVFEVLVFDDDARALITAGQIDQLKLHLRKRKAIWLQEAAMAKVVEGVTSIAEVTRVFAKKE